MLRICAASLLVVLTASLALADPPAKPEGPEKPPEKPTIESVTKERDELRTQLAQCQAVAKEIAPLARTRALELFGNLQ